MMGRAWHELTAHERQQLMLAVGCPTCGASTGQACISRSGKPTVSLHAGRFWAAHQRAHQTSRE